MTRPTLPDLSTVSLQQLKYLAALTTEATYAEIATDLNVTQSAVSQGIARLEELLGLSLVEPVGRRRRLTAGGERVAAYAGLTLEATEALIDELGSHQAGDSGTLRIGMVDAAAMYLFDGAIADLSKNPDIDLRMVVDGSDALLDRLAGFQDEMAVVVEPADGFWAVPLASEDLHLYGPDDEVGSGASWVLYPSRSHTRRIVDDGLSRLGISPRAVIESGNPAVQRQLARLTNSWTVLPARVAESGRQGLTRRRGSVATRTFVLVRRMRSEPSPLAARFAAALTSLSAKSGGVNA